MTNYLAIREKPALAPYKPGDILVLFGELFQRGYANGLVEEALERKMQVIYATVGRRDKDGSLRALNSEELSTAMSPLINIPLEAGFDMEPSSQGLSPVDQLKEAKLNSWNECHLDFDQIKDSRERGVTRFKKSVSSYLQELEKHIAPGKNVVFAHLMAGGVPRTKIVMPLMNRVFKGTGDRYLASEEFWNSDIGRLCEMSFTEVTAETFRHLLELSTPLKNKIESAGGHVSYVAYGYHGTEVIMDNKYQWQTYTPYLQGGAKKQLENISAEFFAKGYNCCVYNCPEILTNSSSIFKGVEVCLYPLTKALQKETKNSPQTQEILTQCQSLLKDGITFDQVAEKTSTYASQKIIQEHCVFEKWPQHSSALQLETMLNFSDELISFHKDEKQLMTSILSEVIFESCGYVMLHNSWKPQAAVAWINHDVVARCLN